jgi:Icc-related predicted phosphoesterase
LRFVAISDTHGRHRELKLPKGDVLLHTGDLTTRGRKDEAADFLGWFAQQPFAHKIFIAGNHDFYFEKAKAAELEALVPQGVTYLNDSGTEVNGLKVWGSPITPWFFDWAFNRHRGAEIRKHWELIPSDTNILLTHGPVHGFLDLTVTDQHVGCQDLLRQVLLIKPRVHIFGHIHEAYGSIRRSGVHFINASVVNERYILANKPVVFDL